MEVYYFLIFVYYSSKNFCVVRFKVWACGRDVGRDHVYIPGELILVKEKPSESDDEREVEVTPPLTRALSTKMLDMVT